MDSVSEARLQLVWPVLAAKIHTLADMLAQENIEIRVVQGLRSWVEQDALYAQGRKAPGKIVTNAKGGQSYHNFSMAVDCVPSQFGPDQPYSPDWNPSHPAWKRMEAVAISLGLDSGSTWEHADCPHLQLTGIFPLGAPNESLHKIFLDSGVEAVWAATGIIDDHLGSPQGSTEVLA